jgi:hypothetical protein
MNFVRVSGCGGHDLGASKNLHLRRFRARAVGKTDCQTVVNLGVGVTQDGFLG